MPLKPETKIWLALNERIKTLPFTPKLPIAYAGKTYAPVDGKAFLAVNKISVDPIRLFIGDQTNERTGTLTITFVSAINNDTSYYEEQAGTIADHFRQDTLMAYEDVCVRVISQPHVVSGFQDNGWWRVPVNIRWQTYI
jgi:hypothetical protein